MLYAPKLPDQPTFAPSFESDQELTAARNELWNATRDLQIYRDNSNARGNAEQEAYERRIRAIHEATGVQIDNPMKKPGNTIGPDGKLVVRTRQQDEAEFRQALFDVAEAHPDAAAVVGLDRPIEEDAKAIARESEARFTAAQQRAAAAGVGRFGQLANVFGGGTAGMLRDPLQVSTLFVGGTLSAPAKTVFGRVIQRIFTEAAINAGVETAVQASSYKWKEEAGVEHGLGASLQQIGLAALFGGGFGGLFQGGGEIFKLLGKTAPTEAMARLAAGEPQPGDAGHMAAELGVKLDDETVRLADMAAEQDGFDVDAFGRPPAGMTAGEATSAAAEALRLVDDAPDLLPGADLQARAATIDRIVRSEFPLGPEPRRPVTLMQFLASRDVGGVQDEGGALAAMGLERRFIPGSGALVRKNGKSLDYAREAAAEAGYFDDAYGDPATAVAQSTPDDLLRAIETEAGGDPVFSARNDGGRVFDWQEYQTGRRRQESYRRIVEEVAGAVDDLGIDHQVDDALLVRASQLVDDETDAVTALERAIEEDYRNYADTLAERGEGFDNEPEYDTPFFETAAQSGSGSRPVGDARSPGQDGTAGRLGPDDADRQQLQAAGADEGAPGGLRAAGATPEPASDEAVAQAEAVLVEARGASETTDAGEQTLIEGVKPVTTKEKLEAKAAKPLRGGDKPMPDGGLFDLESQKQIDIWDAMPAATQADGTVLHATYDTMVADADRSQLFSDLITSCKD